MKSATGDRFILPILKSLSDDARQSMRVLGAAVGLSPPAVTERVRRLEDLGIIQGYRAVLDVSQLGWAISAFIALSARDGRCDLLLDVLKRSKNVLAAFHVAGETDFLARVVAHDLIELKALTERLAEFAFVSSHVILNVEFERLPI